MSQPYQPPTKRRGPLPWILGGGAVVLLLCVGFALLGALVGDDDTDASTSGSPTTAAAVGQRAPAPADFKLTAKITEQTCYGEAGCSITWQPVIVYSGPAIADGDTWLVAYKVSGLESGTKAGTIVVGSTGPAKQSEKHGRTAGENSKVKLTVTGVEKDG